MSSVFLRPVDVLRLDVLVDCMLPLYKGRGGGGDFKTYGALSRCKYCPSTGRLLEVSSLCRPVDSRGSFLVKDQTNQTISLIPRVTDLTACTTLDPLIFIANYFLHRTQSTSAESRGICQDSFAWLEAITEAYSNEYGVHTAESLRKVFVSRGMETLLNQVCEVQTMESVAYYRFSRSKCVARIADRIKTAQRLVYKEGLEGMSQIFVAVALAYYHSAVHTEVCSSLAIDLSLVAKLVSPVGERNHSSQNQRVQSSTAVAEQKLVVKRPQSPTQSEIKRRQIAKECTKLSSFFKPK